MPLPLNQSTKRFSIGAAVLTVAAGSAAYAVPVELNIEISGGRPTTTGACESVRPLRKILRESLGRLVMTCDMRVVPGGRSIPPCDQGYHQFPETELRLAEIFERTVEQRPVGR